MEIKHGNKTKMKRIKGIMDKFKTFDPWTGDEYIGHLQIFDGKLYGISTAKPLVVKKLEDLEENK